MIPHALARRAAIMIGWCTDIAGQHPLDLVLAYIAQQSSEAATAVAVVAVDDETTQAPTPATQPPCAVQPSVGASGVAEVNALIDAALLSVDVYAANGTPQNEIARAFLGRARGHAQINDAWSLDQARQSVAAALTIAGKRG